MERRLQAALLAGVFFVSAKAEARAGETGDALAHVNAVIAAPQPQALSLDPCAERRWSIARPLAFCGRIRLVPGDAAERALWWGQRISEFLDAYASARGQSDLFAQRQVVVVARGVTAEETPETFILRGQAWTIAEEEGVATPARAEANALLKPLAAGGFGGYLLGFGLIDAGESLLTGLAPSLGLRPLDELSRRSVLTNNISAHLQGAQSWMPVFNVARNVNAIVRSCEQLAAESWSYDPAIDKLFIAPAPKRCATIWPSTK